SCHVCGREVIKDSPESAADETLAALDDGTRFYVLFPIHHTSAPEKGKRKKAGKSSDNTEPLSVAAHLILLLQQGFSRLYRAGEAIELTSPDDYAFADFEETFVLIDRLKARADSRQRLVDSLGTCVR